MKTVRGIFMRGGTSKGVYFHAKDLPSDPKLRDKVILDVYGSPDITEIDGLGGADVLTSKTAIIERSARKDADVDYTFGQVMFTEALVDYRINCGNISAGVGPFAVDEGLVDAVEPITRVRIYNTNTQKILIAEVPVKNGKAVVEGDYSISGVPGTGAKITLDFSQTVGSQGMGLLPTGKVSEKLTVKEVGTFDVSIVDAANLAVFVPAEAVGLSGKERFEEILHNKKLGEIADNIRGTVGVKLGLYPDLKSFLSINPTMPFCIFVHPPVDYVNYENGDPVLASSQDLRGLIRFAGAFHHAYSGTGAVCTAVAARIEGTTVHDAVPKERMNEPIISIGHPSGIIEVEIRVEKQGDDYKILRAAYGRTSRRIMEGTIHLKPWAERIAELR